METEEYPKHQDDRELGEERELCVLWGGRDSILSGWGPSTGRAAMAFWACREEDSDIVEAWVRSRSDIPTIRRHESTFKCTEALVHIYAVRFGHPALSGGAV